MFIHTACNILISNRKMEILKLTGMPKLSHSSFSEEGSQAIWYIMCTRGLCSQGFYF